jgi:hypothetical protein
VESGKLSQEEKIWFVWLLTMLGSFAILESHTIVKRKKHGTLTYTLRKHLGIYPRRRWRLVGTGMVIGFSVWFAVHIVTGGWVPKLVREIEKHVD